MTSITWSPQQEAIFEWFKHGSGNLVVRARAGTGKTTTIVEAIKHAPEEDKLLAAFNKRIAVELATRAETATVKTLHALGYAFIRKHWKDYGSIQVDARRTMGILFALAKKHSWGYLGKLPARWISSLATLAKESHPFECIDEDKAFECILDLGMAHGQLLDLQRVGTPPERAVKMVHEICKASKEFDGKIDYADMLFLPLVLGIAEPVFDLVVIDEAQDMNSAQLTLAMMSCSEDGRIAVVGDDRQAIYGFRGADSGAIDRLKLALNAQELPLTATYRCPQAIVQEANRLVPDLEAFSQETGKVETVEKAEELVRLAQAGDFILSRTNADLASVCLALLRASRPAQIVGKDIGEHLITHIDKQPMSKDEDTIADFLCCLKEYEETIVRSLIANDKEEMIESFLDLTNTIRVLSEGCVNVGSLKERIRNLFVDRTPEDMIVLSTVHKAKGLEAERVFVLKSTLYRYSADIEEQNIEYVAITRSKKELYWVGKTYGGKNKAQ